MSIFDGIFSPQTQTGFGNLMASGALGQLGAGLLSGRGAQGIMSGFGGASNAIAGFQQKAAQKALMARAGAAAGFSPQQQSVFDGLPLVMQQEVLQRNTFPKFNKDQQLLGALGDPSNPLNAAARTAYDLDPGAKTQLTQSGLNFRHSTVSADKAAGEAGQDRRQAARLSQDEVQDIRSNKLARDKFAQDKFEFGQEYAIKQYRADLDGKKFDRGVLESDRDFGRGVFENDRDFVQGVTEFDRTDATRRAGQGVTMRGQDMTAANAQAARQAAAAKATAMPESQREIERLQSIGIPYEQAVKIKEGVLKVVRDPLTGEATVVDLSTNQPTPQIPPSVVQQSQTASPPVDYGNLPRSTPAAGAFGVEGAAKGAINAIGDTIGLGTAFPDVQATQADFGVLREQLINDVASAYDRQPPSWLLKNIEGLTPQAGSVRQGPDSAKTQLGALRRSFETELENSQKRARQRLSPTERQKLEAKMAGLSASLARLDGALDRFDQSGGNVTSSGVKWSIK